MKWWCLCVSYRLQRQKNVVTEKGSTCSHSNRKHWQLRLFVSLSFPCRVSLLKSRSYFAVFSSSPLLDLLVITSGHVPGFIETIFERELLCSVSRFVTVYLKRHFFSLKFEENSFVKTAVFPVSVRGRQDSLKHDCIWHLLTRSDFHAKRTTSSWSHTT